MNRKVLYAQHQKYKSEYVRNAGFHALSIFILTLSLIILMVVCMVIGERWQTGLFFVLFLLSGITGGKAADTHETTKALIDLWDRELAADQEIDDLLRNCDAQDSDSQEFPKAP